MHDDEIDTMLLYFRSCVRSIYYYYEPNRVREVPKMKKKKLDI